MTKARLWLDAFVGGTLGAFLGAFGIFICRHARPWVPYAVAAFVWVVVVTVVAAVVLL